MLWRYDSESQWRHFDAPDDKGAATDAPPARRTKSDDSADVVKRLKDLETALAGEEEAKRLAQSQKLAELEQKYEAERRDRALAQVAVQYPSADRELVSEYPSKDPDAILAYASKLHEKAQMRIYDANGVPLPPSNQTDAALSAEESQIRRWQIAARHNHLRKQIDPIEAEQAFETFFRRSWNSHMDERRRRSGMPVASLPRPDQ